MTENRGAAQDVTPLRQEEKLKEHEKMFTERCTLLTGAF